MKPEDKYKSDQEKQKIQRELERREKEEERQEEDLRYHNEQTNHNVGDPTAKRNMGPGGMSGQSDDKGQLHNLVIEGNEATGYGDNSDVEAKSGNGGPGFQAEGGEYASPPIRQDDQPAD
jgi:hypothetical protein